MADHFIGIDVGTGSARAGVFDARGRMHGTAKRDIAMFSEPGSIVEQSSADIWSAVCTAVRGAVAAAGVAPAEVKGIGFDATCSLVVLGEGGTPLPVGPSEDRPATSSSGWTTAPSSRPGASTARGPGSAQRRRHHLAGDGDPEAPMAPREPSGGIRRRVAVLRPDRLPYLEGLREPRPLRLHRHLQVDLPRPRAALGPRLLPHHRSRRARGRGLRSDRAGDRRPRHAARTGPHRSRCHRPRAPPRNPDRCGTDRRACRRHRHGRRAGRPGAHHGLRLRDLVVHDDDYPPPGPGPRGLGPLLLCNGPRHVAERGRPVRRGRCHRPARLTPPRSDRGGAPRRRRWPLAAGMARRPGGGARPLRGHRLSRRASRGSGVSRQPRALRRSPRPRGDRRPRLGARPLLPWWLSTLPASPAWATACARSSRYKPGTGPDRDDGDQRWRRPPFVDPPDPRRRYRPPHRHYRSRGARATRLGRPCCRGRRRVTRHPRGHAAMSRVATTSEPAGAAIAEAHSRRYEAFQALQRTARSLPRE